MNDSAYLDTSVLAKWYLKENQTDAVTQYIVALERAIISTLTITEMRSLLARRKRMRDFNDAVEQQIYATFLNDIDRGYLSVESFDDDYFISASHLIATQPKVPLRTLDALHLSLMQQQNITCLATADAVMMKAARHIGIKVKYFGTLEKNT